MASRPGESLDAKEPVLSIAIGAFLLAVAIGTALEASSWRPEVSLFPLVAAALLGVGAAGQLAIDGYRYVRLRQSRRGDVAIGGWRARLQSAGIVDVAWFAMVVPLIWLLGMIVGLPVAAFLIARFPFGERLRTSAVLSLATLLLLLAFDRLLNVFWPTPFLLELF